MPSRVKRRYRSPQRTEQANATRREILEAARRLFTGSGYGRTTMEAVAAAADVSVATVYLAFRSKLGLLSALVAEAAEDPALDVQMVLDQPDLDRQVPFGVHLARQLHERTAGISDILRAGRGNDARLEALWDQWQAGHLHAMRRIAHQWASQGRLRPGIQEAQAADVLYVLSGSETYRQFVFERGWSAAQFEEWLTVAIRRLLVAEAESGSPRGPLTPG
jgi:AcrR family transcriptional regulator